MRNYLCVLFIVFLILPTSVYAALININTADATLLDTLPGIGASYAADIIAYREAHGPFTTIEDLKKVPNIGSGSRYANIAPLITVGDAGASASTSDTASSTTSEVLPTTTGTSTYTPPPAALTLDISAVSQNAVVEVPLHLVAHVLTKGGAVDLSAHTAWGFGDGSSAEGTIIEKVYRYAGTYLITVTATDGLATARNEIVVTVRPAQVRILDISSSGITVANEANERLDLSGWSLTTDTGLFRIPSGTLLLPKASVLFPFTIMNLPMPLSATLVYPDGVIAARFPPPLSIAPTQPTDTTQPSLATTSYEKVQAVEPISSTKANIQRNEEAVRAPAATTELAAAGAALPPTLPVGAPTSDVGAASRISHLFRSPWTLRLLGVIAAAGGAFILL